MILVDTSVWIDYFNGRPTPQTDLLDILLAEEEVAVGDLILLEILQGFRREEDFRTACDLLAALRTCQLLTPELAIKGAQNYRHLRKRGITIRKTPDIIIATFCIEHQIPLLHADKDFIPFMEHLGLQSPS